MKLYNKATAPATTDVPLFTIPVRATSEININTISGIVGHYFALGLGIGITGNYADNDNTAITANTVFLNLSYS